MNTKTSTIVMLNIANAKIKSPQMAIIHAPMSRRPSIPPTISPIKPPKFSCTLPASFAKWGAALRPSSNKVDVNKMQPAPTIHFFIMLKET